MVFAFLVPVSSRSSCLPHLPVSLLFRVRDVRPCVACHPDLPTRPSSRTRVGLSGAHTMKQRERRPSVRGRTQNKTQQPPNMTKSFIGSKRNVCPSQNLFHPPPVDNDRKRLLKVSILTKSLVFIS